MSPLKLPSASLLGTIYALTAACLFGLSTPLAKALLSQVEPWMLAGLLFLGGGLGLIPLYLVRLGQGQAGPRPQGKDWRWLALSIVAGGVVGPVLLTLGLTVTSASVASLLLAFEGVFTGLLAWTVFRERWQLRVFLGIVAITTGGIVLSGAEHASGGFTWGALAILATCLMWSIDSNCTYQVSHCDPLLIASLKSSVAGGINVAVAIAIGQPIPPAPVLSHALWAGFLAYGLTLLCFVLALRYVGASRTGAYFGFSPFVGALIGVIALGEAFTAPMGIAAACMALGVGLCIKA